MRDILSNAIEDLLVYYVSEQIPFSIIVDNHNDWDIQLPERLNKLPNFLLNVQNTDLEDSYVSAEGDVIITAGIDDIVYQKAFKACDVHAIGAMGKQADIVKQFRDEPLIKALSPEPADEAGLLHSMECFKKYNPSLFKAGATPPEGMYKGYKDET